MFTVRGEPRLANLTAADLSRTLGLLDLASLKINKSKPRRLVLTIWRLHSTNVASIGIHSPAASRFTGVTAVAAFGGPRLVIFLTVVSQSYRPNTPYSSSLSAQQALVRSAVLKHGQLTSSQFRRLLHGSTRGAVVRSSRHLKRLTDLGLVRRFWGVHDGPAEYIYMPAGTTGRGPGFPHPRHLRAVCQSNCVTSLRQKCGVCFR